VTALRRRVAPLLLVAVAVAGCGSTVTPSAAPSASAGPSPAEPSLTPIPGGKPTPAATLPTTTQTEFGEIWDALPPSWPTLPGQSESEVGSDASERLVVKGTPRDLAGQLRTALEAAGWHVDVGLPLEDGSVVVDATHAPNGCQVHAQFFGSAATDPDTLLVYYGAKCPFA
jgi:hypothetical protein